MVKYQHFILRKLVYQEGMSVFGDVSFYYILILSELWSDTLPRQLDKRKRQYFSKNLSDLIRVQLKGRAVKK